MMRVVLAQPRGFCAGVVRAIDIVERALEKYGEPVYVRHEIVHNKHVVDTLKNKGARFVEELDEVPDGAVTVFSAHGVPQTVVKEAKSRGLPVLDATCPLVSKVHNQGKRYVAHGRQLILIGHAGHPEVEGTMGQVGAPVTLVQSEADVAALTIPTDTPVAYITQTTLSIDDTKSHHRRAQAQVHRHRRARDHRHLLCDAKSPDCRARTGQGRGRDFGRRRQEQFQFQPPGRDRPRGRRAELSDRRRQRTRCRRGCAGKNTVGLTAGASAPEALVEHVIDALGRIAPVEVATMDGKKEHIEFRLPAELRD